MSARPLSFQQVLAILMLAVVLGWAFGMIGIRIVEEVERIEAGHRLAQERDEAR